MEAVLGGPESGLSTAPGVSVGTLELPIPTVLVRESCIEFPHPLIIKYCKEESKGKMESESLKLCNEDFSFEVSWQNGGDLVNLESI